MIKIKKGSILYEGKQKVIYSTANDEQFIMRFKDVISHTNKVDEITAAGKGALCNRISQFLMSRLGEIGIPNHYIQNINMKEQLIKAAIPYPFKMVISNVSNGKMSERLQIEEGVILPNPIVEIFSVTKTALSNLLNDDHVSTFRIADKYELEEMKLYTYRINDFLCGIFNAIGIRLVSVELLFGKASNYQTEGMILINDISPDNCKLWDLKTNNILDKYRYINNLDEIMLGYKTISKKLGIA